MKTCKFIGGHRKGLTYILGGRVLLFLDISRSYLAPFSPEISRELGTFWRVFTH